MRNLSRKAKHLPPSKRVGPHYYRVIPITHDVIVPPKKPTKGMDTLSHKQIYNRNKGETIFLLGNGPSLLDGKKYKKQLESKCCLSIYVAYWMFHCDYVLFSDLPKYDADVYEELLALDSYVFVKDYSKKHYVNFPRYFNKIPTKPISNDGALSDSLTEPFYNGGGSVFLAINLAYILGAKNIAMLGIDMDSGEHFYDKIKKFHKNSFYKYGASINAKRNPPGRGYKGSVRARNNMKKVKKFLKDKGVGLFNCSKRSVIGGTYIPLDRALCGET